MYPLTKFIQRHIPTASLVEEIGSDIVFILPTKDSEENPMKQFEVLFKELDKNLAQLNIATYGLSDTTLEDVGKTNANLYPPFFSQIFLKVASNENDGAIVRGSKGLARSQSSKAPFHLPPLRVNNQQIEDDSTDESGEIGFSFLCRVFKRSFTVLACMPLVVVSLLMSLQELEKFM